MQREDDKTKPTTTLVDSSLGLVTYVFRMMRDCPKSRFGQRISLDTDGGSPLRCPRPELLHAGESESGNATTELLKQPREKIYLRLDSSHSLLEGTETGIVRQSPIDERRMRPGRRWPDARTNHGRVSC
jgi:hypothetical protein